MQSFARRAGLVAAGVVLGLYGFTGAAFAGDYCEKDCPPPPPPPPTKSQCNAGNGNGSDLITFVEGEHCYGGDPGNSYNAGNRGGDEIPTSGGVPNPGGNNDPG